jgi:pimeloyl-ACP methyl ester carboxylesterase
MEARENSTMWMGDVPALARAFRVYCIDVIGEPGLSAAARPSLASDAHAVWLDDVLNHFAIDSASIVGVSLGGWLALDYAIRRQARIQNVAVICPGGIGRQKLGIVFLTLWFRMFGRWGKRKLAERILGRPSIDPPPPVKAFVDFVALIHRHFRPRMVKLPIFSDTDLSKLKSPVLAIVGARDVLLDSAQTKQRLEQYASNAQVVYLANKGHFIARQTPRIFEFMQAQTRKNEIDFIVASE